MASGGGWTYRWRVVAQDDPDRDLAALTYTGASGGSGALAIEAPDPSTAELVDYHLRQVGALAGAPGRGTFAEVDEALRGFEQRFRQFRVVREGERRARSSPEAGPAAPPQPLEALLAERAGELAPDFEIDALAVAPVGPLLALGGAEGGLELWDSEAGAPVLRLGGHDDTVRALAFSPDGSLLASGGGDRAARLWRVGDGALLATLSGPEVSAVAFAPDGRTLLTGGGDGLTRLWTTGGELVRELTGHDQRLVAAAFSADGQLLLSAGQDHCVRLRDAAGGAVVRSFWLGADPARAAGFAGPDCCAYLAKGRLSLLDGRTGLVPWSTAIPGRRARCLAIDVDGAVAAVGSSAGAVLFYEIEGGTPIGSLSARGAVHALAFAGPRRLISAGPSGVQMWRLAGTAGRAPRRSRTGKFPIGPQSQLIYARPVAHALAAAMPGPAGDAVLGAGSDGTLHLFRASDGEPLASADAHAGGVQAVAFSRDGTQLFSAGKDGAVRVWDRTLTQLRSFAGEAPLTCLSVSADGRLLAAGGSAPEVVVWAMASGERVARLPCATGFATASLAFAPDGGALAITDRYGAAQVWDVGRAVRLDLPDEDHALRAVACSPGARVLLTGTARGVALTERVGLRQAGDEALLRLFERRRGNDVLIAAVAPGARLAAVVLPSGALALLDVAAESLVAVLGATGELATAAFLPDALHLITAGEELRLWRLELDPPAAGRA